VKILRQVLESVADHARRGFPCECCGILLYTGDDLSTVSCVLPAENIEKENPERGYLLDHKAHLRAVEMEALGDASIAGYYHSHPYGRARPSCRDVEQAVHGVIYLITGLEGGGRIEHAAWRLEGDNMIPEPLEVVNNI
jgi:proteasome lid subunit RPN8/RPN11